MNFTLSFFIEARHKLPRERRTFLSSLREVESLQKSRGHSYYSGVKNVLLSLLEKNNVIPEHTDLFLNNNGLPLSNFSKATSVANT